MRLSTRFFVPLLCTIPFCLGAFDNGRRGGRESIRESWIIPAETIDVGAGGFGGGARGAFGGGIRGVFEGGERGGRKDERFPPSGESYWIPYGDRTVAAMSFPVVPVSRDLYGPPAVQDIQLTYGKVKRDQYGSPVLQEIQPAYGKVKEPYGKAKGIPKTKSPGIQSDLGVVVSRNSVLKRNFRDYERLSLYSGDEKAPNELLLDEAKSLAQSHLSTKKGQTFVVVAFESRLKTPSREKISGSVGDSRVLHNGTIIFPDPRNSGSLTTLPFSLKKLQEFEEVFGEFRWPESHLEEATTSFVKLLGGIHKDTHEDGRDALERFAERSRRLERPEFGVAVEDVAHDRRDDSFDKQRREETAQMERMFRNEAWLSTSTIGIRTISAPPQAVEELELPPLHPPKLEEGYNNGGSHQQYASEGGYNNKEYGQQYKPPNTEMRYGEKKPSGGYGKEESVSGYSPPDYTPSRNITTYYSTYK